MNQQHQMELTEREIAEAALVVGLATGVSATENRHILDSEEFNYHLLIF